jgi:hypothetical protein
LEKGKWFRRLEIRKKKNKKILFPISSFLSQFLFSKQPISKRLEKTCCLSYVSNGVKFKVKSSKLQFKVQSFWKIVDWKGEGGAGKWRLEKR